MSLLAHFTKSYHCNITEFRNRKMAVLGGICGGLTAERGATAETQELCDQLKPAVESLAQTRFAEFKAIQFSSQVVAGVNYFIKIRVGKGDYIHMRVFQPLPNTGERPRVDGLEKSKSLEDPIKYID